MTKTELVKLIKTEGSAYKAARALQIAPQSFYERMRKYGLKPAGYRRLPGEPDTKNAKRQWLLSLLEEGSVRLVAKRLGSTETAIRARMRAYGIRMSLPMEKRVRSLKSLLKKHKTGYKVAKVLGQTPQTVYEKIKLYGL